MMLTVEDVIKEWKNLKPCLVGNIADYALDYLNRIERIVDQQKLASGGSGAGRDYAIGENTKRIVIDIRGMGPNDTITGADPTRLIRD